MNSTAESKRGSAKDRAREKLERESESSFEDDPDVIEWGGQFYLAADFTAGGAPIGLSLAEHRELEVRSSTEGWARAKRVLDCVFDEYGKIDIGRVVKMGQGLSYQVFAANVEVQNDSNALSGDYAVLLPVRSQAQSKEERMATRAKLLQERSICRCVAAQTTSIRVPELRAIIPLPEGDAIVRPFLRGMPLDLRTGKQPTVKPWEIVARVAATIHAVDIGEMAELRGFPTRLAHALSEIEQLRSVPECSEAYSWALEHLPPDEPSVLIHGDLLGQNILLGIDEPPAVIDWEHAMSGDPAYDLAIVTRGSKKPFAADRGLERLLDSYARFRGTQVAAHEVYFYELCLVARWYRDAIEGKESGESAESIYRQLNALLGRARRATMPENQ